MIQIVLILHIIKTATGDPVLSGGHPCRTSWVCSNGGICVYTNVTNGACRCFNDRGKPDCSYVRYNKYLGLLNILLPLIGICGIGNICIGYIAEGLIQLLLGLSIYCCAIPAGRTARILPNDYCILIMAIEGMMWSVIDGFDMISGRITDVNGFNLY